MSIYYNLLIRFKHFQVTLGLSTKHKNSKTGQSINIIIYKHKIDLINESDILPELDKFAYNFNRFIQEF